MQKVNEIDSSPTYDEETLEKLREYGIFVKGTSKAFTTFLVLWYLSKRDMHGYLIMKRIDDFFEPQIGIGLMKETKANKIYPLLKSLTEYNLIEFYPGIHKKKEVKIYHLTEEGHKTLELIKKSYYKTVQTDIWKELFTDLKLFNYNQKIEKKE